MRIASRGRQTVKRIVVCYDGTWNALTDPATITNVVRLGQAVKKLAEDGTHQVVYYNAGVGSGGPLDRFLGGVFGVGLRNNVKRGLAFLTLNWNPEGNDEIYIFGFSRGAYSARALAGVIGAIRGIPKQEYFDRLRMAFDTMRQRGGVGAELDAIRIAAALAHYVSDSVQPFHAVVNYDGQLTQQKGIHARFETALFQRFNAQLAIAPSPIAPVRDMTGAIFDTLIEGTRLVPVILKADLTAGGARQVYDDAYFAAFFRESKSVLERRLNESIALVAASISGAWR